MAETKWVKFEVNMFDDTKLKIIDSMDKRDLIIYIWTRLLVLAGKINCGGELYITYNIAYTIKNLAIEFNRNIDEVKTAVKVLKKLEMIEFTEDKAFKIKNWEKHQNVEGMDRLRNENSKRVAKHRAKKKEIKQTNEEEGNNHVSNIDESSKQVENNDNEINYEEENDKVNPSEDKENNYVMNEEAVDVKDNSIEETNNEIKTNEYSDSYDSNNAFEPINENGSNSNNVNDTGNTDDNIENNANKNCNVTCNDDDSSCNITVMEQKKREKEIKKKIEKKIEIESDFNKAHEEGNNSIEFSESSHPSGNDENIDNKAIASLLNHYENITGICGGLNLGAVKLAISMHGYESVKMAINKAIEVNKPNMTYINGILKNWRKEGYPNQREEIKNGARSTGKSNSADKNEFVGFKPKKPRNLTEAERKGAEEELI